MRYVYADPILREDKPSGALVIFLDASDLQTAEWELWRLNAIRFVVLAVALALIALLVVRMSLTQPLAKMARWTKAVRRGHAIEPPELPDQSPGPIAREVTVLAEEPPAGAGRRGGGGRAAPDRPDPVDRGAAQAVRQDAARGAAAGGGLEPRALHPRQEGGPDPGNAAGQRPGHRARAGHAGLSAAPGSRMAAATPTGRPWMRTIASGCRPTSPRTPCGASGSPPRRKRLLLRVRQRGAVAAVPHRPRAPASSAPSDWPQYRRVNQRSPTRCSRRRQRRPDGPGAGLPLRPAAADDQARSCPTRPSLIFWHIPWPNSEAFAHLPLAGRAPARGCWAAPPRLPHPVPLQQLPRHVERAIEARIDRERFAVTRGQHVTSVKPFPISDGLPGCLADPPATSAGRRCSTSLELHRPQFLGVGVERLDYTKGMPERFRAVEPLLRALPGVRGASCSCSSRRPAAAHQRYQALEAEVDAGGAGGQRAPSGPGRWQPIIYLKRAPRAPETSAATTAPPTSAW